MTESPKRVADLFRAITALSGDLGTTERRLVALVANVALSQMLPDSAIKGGTSLKLRFGERLTRDTPDVDAASGATSMSSAIGLPKTWLSDGADSPGP